jgi:hypothetical protein
MLVDKQVETIDNLPACVGNLIILPTNAQRKRGTHLGAEPLLGEFMNVVLDELPSLQLTSF